MVTLKFISMLAITIGIVSGLLILAGVLSMTSNMATAFAVHPLQLPPV